MPDHREQQNAYLHTVDLCILRYCRDSQSLQVLVNKREADPFAGHWALPGIVVNGDTADLTLDDAVKRLRTSAKVGMELAYIEQVGTVGDAFRDPRCWSSSTFYLAIVCGDPLLQSNQAFVALRDVVDGTTRLPFDHNQLVTASHERLVSKSLYSSLPLMFLGTEFSAPQAVNIFSLVLARPVLKTSMRQRLLKMTEAGYLQETGRKKPGEGGRPQATLEHLRPADLYLFDRCFQE